MSQPVSVRKLMLFQTPVTYGEHLNCIEKPQSVVRSVNHMCFYFTWHRPDIGRGSIFLFSRRRV